MEENEVQGNAEGLMLSSEAEAQIFDNPGASVEKTSLTPSDSPSFGAVEALKMPGTIDSFYNDLLRQYVKIYKPDEYTPEERERVQKRANAATQLLFQTNIDTLDDDNARSLARTVSNSLFGIPDEGDIWFNERKSKDPRENLRMMRRVLEGDDSLITDPKAKRFEEADDAGKLAIQREEESWWSALGRIVKYVAGASPAWDESGSALNPAGHGIELPNYGEKNAEMFDRAYKAEIAEQQTKYAGRQKLLTILRYQGALSDRGRWALAKSLVDGEVDVANLPTDDKEKMIVMEGFKAARGERTTGSILGIEQDFKNGTDFGNRAQMMAQGAYDALLSLGTDFYDFDKNLHYWWMDSAWPILATRMGLMSKQEQQTRSELQRVHQLEDLAEEAKKQPMPEGGFIGAPLQSLAENWHWFIPYGVARWGARGVKAVKDARAIIAANGVEHGRKALAGGVEMADEALGMLGAGGDIEKATATMARLQELSQQYEARMARYKKLLDAAKIDTKLSVEIGACSSAVAGAKAVTVASFAEEFLRTADASGIDRKYSIPMAIAVGFINDRIEQFEVLGITEHLSANELKSMSGHALAVALKEGNIGAYCANYLRKSGRAGLMVGFTEGGVEEPLQQICINHGAALAKDLEAAGKERDWGEPTVEAIVKALSITPEDLKTYVDTVAEMLPMAFGYMLQTGPHDQLHSAARHAKYSLYDKMGYTKGIPTLVDPQTGKRSEAYSEMVANRRRAQAAAEAAMIENPAVVENINPEVGKGTNFGWIGERGSGISYPGSTSSLDESQAPNAEAAVDEMNRTAEKMGLDVRFHAPGRGLVQISNGNTHPKGAGAALAEAEQVFSAMNQMGQTQADAQTDAVMAAMTPEQRKVAEARLNSGKLLRSARKIYDEVKDSGDIIGRMMNELSVKQDTAEILTEYFQEQDLYTKFDPTARLEIGAVTPANVTEEALRIHKLGTFDNGKSVLTDAETGNKAIAFKVGDRTVNIVYQDYKPPFINEKGEVDPAKVAALTADDSSLGRSYDERFGSGEWKKLGVYERRRVLTSMINGMADEGREFVFTDAKTGEAISVKADHIVNIVNGRYSDIAYDLLPAAAARHAASSLEWSMQTQVEHETFHALWKVVKETLTKEDLKDLASMAGISTEEDKWEDKLEEHLAAEFESFATGSTRHNPLETKQQKISASLSRLLSRFGAKDITPLKQTDEGLKPYALADFYRAVLEGRVGSGNLGIRHVDTSAAAKPSPTGARESGTIPVPVTSADRTKEEAREKAEAGEKPAPSATPAAPNTPANDWDFGKELKLKKPGEPGRYVVRLRVMNANDLLTSFNPGVTNPFQNRDENTTEAENAVARMVPDVDFDFAGAPSAKFGGSTLVVDKRGFLIVGNHRARAVQLAAAANNEAWRRYRARVMAEADARGLSIDEHALEAPVLVGELEAIEDNPSVRLEDLGRMGNAQDTRGSNEYEQAVDDSQVMERENILHGIVMKADGSVDLSKSLAAVRRFVEKTGAQGMLDEKGDSIVLTGYGRRRIGNAVLALLLGGSKEAMPVLRKLLDVDKNGHSALDIDNENGALASVAAEILNLAADRPMYDIRKDILAALAKYLEWRQIDEQKRAEKGKTVAEWFKGGGYKWADFAGQTDLFTAENPTADMIAGRLAESRLQRSFNTNGDETAAGQERATRHVTDWFNKFVERARKVNVETDDMFGTPPASAAELLGLKFSVSIGGLYHGSAADWVEPDLAHIGSGQGQAVQGYGLNLTDRRFMAEMWARLAGRRFHPRTIGERVGMMIHGAPRYLYEGSVKDANIINFYAPAAAEAARLVEIVDAEGYTHDPKWFERHEPTGQQLERFLSVNVRDRNGEHLSPAACAHLMVLAGVDGNVMDPVGDGLEKTYVIYNTDKFNVDHKWANGVQKFSVSLPKFVLGPKEIAELIGTYGLTDRIGEAVYMLPDGHMLKNRGFNIMGRTSYSHNAVIQILAKDKYPIPEGMEYDDKLSFDRERTQNVQQAFSDARFLRMNSGSGYIELFGKPTDAQSDKLWDVLDIMEMDAAAEGEDSIMVEISDRNGGSQFTVDYPVKTSPRRILEDIHNWYNSGILPTKAYGALAELAKAAPKAKPADVKQPIYPTRGRVGDLDHMAQPPRGRQKLGSTVYPNSGEEIEHLNFSVGAKRAAEIRELFERKRPDVAPEDVAAYIEEIGKYNEPKKQKLAVHWLIAGTIELPQDAFKLDKAMKTAERAKVDPFQYKNPEDIFAAFPQYLPKEKAIDPDTVPELKNRTELPNGVVVYDVDETPVFSKAAQAQIDASLDPVMAEQYKRSAIEHGEARPAGQIAMRKIINSHWGKDASPWCLLQGDEKGRLTSDADYYWNHYDALTKRVAFRNGKLLAFMATHDTRGSEVHGRDWDNFFAPYDLEYNSTPDEGESPYDWMKRVHPTELAEYERKMSTVIPEEWWDRKDLSHAGVPITGVIPGDALGRSGTTEIDTKTGKSRIVGALKLGDRNNGVYEEWYYEDHLREHSSWEDGKMSGAAVWWYENGDVYRITTTDGMVGIWSLDGDLQTLYTTGGDGKIVGPYREFEHGILKSYEYHDPKLGVVTLDASWDELDALRSYIESDILPNKDGSLHSRPIFRYLDQVVVRNGERFVYPYRRSFKYKDGNFVYVDYYRESAAVKEVRLHDAHLVAIKRWNFEDPAHRGMKIGDIRVTSDDTELRDIIDAIRRFESDAIDRAAALKAREQANMPARPNIPMRHGLTDEEIHFSIASNPATDGDIARVIKHYGITDDVREAGFMLPDGRLIDLSGVADGYFRHDGKRHTDHHEVGAFIEHGDDATAGMYDLMAAGLIRLQPEAGGIEVVEEPTFEQLDALESYVEHFNGKVTLDITTPEGHTIRARMYDEGTPAGRVTSDILRHFNGTWRDEQPMFSVQPNGLTRVMLELARRYNYRDIANGDALRLWYGTTYERHNYGQSSLDKAIESTDKWNAELTNVYDSIFGRDENRDLIFRNNDIVLVSDGTLRLREGPSATRDVLDRLARWVNPEWSAANLDIAGDLRPLLSLMAAADTKRLTVRAEEKGWLAQMLRDHIETRDIHARLFTAWRLVQARNAVYTDAGYALVGMPTAGMTKDKYAFLRAHRKSRPSEVEDGVYKATINGICQNIVPKILELAYNSKNQVGPITYLLESHETASGRLVACGTVDSFYQTIAMVVRDRLVKKSSSSVYDFHSYAYYNVDKDGAVRIVGKVGDGPVAIVSADLGDGIDVIRVAQVLRKMKKGGDAGPIPVSILASEGERLLPSQMWLRNAPVNDILSNEVNEDVTQTQSISRFDQLGSTQGSGLRVGSELSSRSGSRTRERTESLADKTRAGGDFAPGAQSNFDLLARNVDINNLDARPLTAAVAKGILRDNSERLNFSIGVHGAANLGIGGLREAVSMDFSVAMDSVSAAEDPDGADESSFSVATRKRRITDYPELLDSVIYATSHVHMVGHDDPITDAKYERFKALKKYSPTAALEMAEEMAGSTWAKERYLGKYLLGKHFGRMPEATEAVRHYYQPKNMDQLREIIGSGQPVWVYVRNADGRRTNMIPRAFAQLLAEKFGGRVSDEVVKKSDERNTGADMQSRLSRSFEWSGKPTTADDSVMFIVDDVWTTGSTTISLLEYLRDKGVKTRGIVTVAVASNSNHVKPTADDWQKVFSKSHTKTIAEASRVAGFDMNKLTGSELYAYGVKGAKGYAGLANWFARAFGLFEIPGGLFANPNENNPTGAEARDLGLPKAPVINHPTQGLFNFSVAFPRIDKMSDDELIVAALAAGSIINPKLARPASRSATPYGFMRAHRKEAEELVRRAHPEIAGDSASVASYAANLVMHAQREARRLNAALAAGVSESAILKRLPKKMEPVYRGELWEHEQRGGKIMGYGVRAIQRLNDSWERKVQGRIAVQSGVETDLFESWAGVDFGESLLKILEGDRDRFAEKPASDVGTEPPNNDITSAGGGGVEDENGQPYKVESLKDPRTFAEYISSLAWKYWREKNGISASEKPWGDAVSLQFFRRTAQNVYRSIVSSIVHSGARETAIRNIEKFTAAPSAQGLLSVMTFVGEVIHARHIRDSKQKMCEDLDNFLKTALGATGRFRPDKEELRRKVTAELELRARYMRHAMWLTKNAAAEEALALTRRMNQLVGKYGEAESDVEQSKEYRDIQRELNILREFGYLRYRTLAEIETARIYWEEAAKGSNEQILQEIQDREIRTRKAAEILAAAVNNPNKGERVDSGLVTDINNYLVAHMGFVAMLEDMTRFSGVPERQAAQQIIHYIALEIQKAGDRAQAEIRDEMNAFYHVVEAVYKRPFNKVMAEMNARDERFAPFMGKRSGKSEKPTKARAMQLLVSLLQGAKPGDSYFDNVVKHDRMHQATDIERLLSPEDLNMIGWLRRWFEHNRGDLSQVCEDLFGIGVYSESPVYFPVKMLREKQGLESYEGVGWTIFPKSLTPRVKNERDFDTSADIFSMWASRMQEGAQWKAHAKLGLELRGIFGRSNLQEAIVANHGNKVNELVLEFITDILSGSAAADRSDSGVGKAADWIRGWTALSALGGNLGVMAKQTTSIPAFGFEIGLVRTAEYMVSAFSPSGIDAMNKLWDSEQRRTRWQVGNSEAVSNALRNRNASMVRKVFQSLMITNKIGDVIPGLLIGQGIYRDCVEQGMSETDAMAETWMLIERTQQSSRIENQPTQQRRSKLGRILYQFLSTQQQYLQYELRAGRDLAASPNGETAKRFLRAVVINHLILPSLYFWMGEFYKMLLGAKPPEDQFKSMLIADLLGPFGALFVLGFCCKATLERAFNGRWRGGNLDMIPMESYIKNQVGDAANLVEAIFSSEDTWGDVIDEITKWASDVNATARDIRRVDKNIIRPEVYERKERDRKRKSRNRNQSGSSR